MIIKISEVWWQFLLLAIGAYLIGNINFAIIISKLKKKDIRTVGSGNPGTLNMSRSFGLGIGVLTLFLDILKGAIPTYIGFIIFQDKCFYNEGLDAFILSEIWCGFFAVLGHIKPVFLKFKGGKGIATTIGVFLVISPRVTIISAICAIAFILFTEIGSMGSFIATTPAAIATIINHYLNYVITKPLGFNEIVIVAISNILLVGIIFMTWFAHKANIERLVAGDEHPTNWGQMIREGLLKKRKK